VVELGGLGDAFNEKLEDAVDTGGLIWMGLEVAHGEDSEGEGSISGPLDLANPDILDLILIGAD
jgi:hypothetical protein